MRRELVSLRPVLDFSKATSYAIGLDKRVFVLSKKDQQSLPFGLDDQSFHKYDSMSELSTYVRETCCGAHRREVFNLSDPFKAKYSESTTLPGVPNWLDKKALISLENRLTISILTIVVSLALLAQIVVKLILPTSPGPTMLAIFSLIIGSLALTRMSREFWEKKIVRWLSWLPWAGVATVLILVAILTLMMTRNAEPRATSSPSPTEGSTPAR